MTVSAEIARYRANYQDEVDGAALYRALSGIEADPRVAALYDRLAATEDGHAEYWSNRLALIGQAPVGERKPGWRTQVVIWLARRLGARIVLPSIAAIERTASAKYVDQPDSPDGMAAEERAHARILGALGSGASARPIAGVLIAVNEGLLASLGLIAGLIGAGVPFQMVGTVGGLGLIAGATSRGVARWLSIQSSRELFARQVETEAAELSASPAAEREELALIYQLRGLDEKQARTMAEDVMADPVTALGTMAREEAGIDPADLSSSPIQAIATSSLLFAIGAMVPLLPYLVLAGFSAVIASLTLSALACFGIGVALTVFIGGSAVFSGLRQLALGLGAAGLAYLLGALLSEALS